NSSASICCSFISRRAFSTRACRSASVMGAIPSVIGLSPRIDAGISSGAPAPPPSARPCASTAPLSPPAIPAAPVTAPAAGVRRKNARLPMVTCPPQMPGNQHRKQRQYRPPGFAGKVSRAHRGGQGMDTPAAPVGIKDIARALGISTGTVDRALHAKPGINPMTRARVLRTAEALGYRPNLAARYLKSRKTLKISVHLPRELALFWDSLREGIREAAAMFEPTLHVDFRSYPRLGKGDVALFEQALNEGTNGLIIAPGDPAALKMLIR